MPTVGQAAPDKQSDASAAERRQPEHQSSPVLGPVMHALEEAGTPGEQCIVAGCLATDHQRDAGDGAPAQPNLHEHFGQAQRHGGAGGAQEQCAACRLAHGQQKQRNEQARRADNQEGDTPRGNRAGERNIDRGHVAHGLSDHATDDEGKA